MSRNKDGFVLLEVMAASSFVILGLLGAMACYLTGLRLMLRHEAREKAMSLAQKAFVEAKWGQLENQEQQEQDFRVIRTSQPLEVGLSGRQVEVAVYYQQEEQPLVNLVFYE